MCGGALEVIPEVRSGMQYAPLSRMFEVMLTPSERSALLKAAELAGADAGTPLQTARTKLVHASRTEPPGPAYTWLTAWLAWWRRPPAAVCVLCGHVGVVNDYYHCADGCPIPERLRRG